MSLVDPAVFRIIDANMNRAREALRVMEEYARFGLADAGLSAAIKETRHALATVATGLDQTLDVGPNHPCAPTQACGSQGTGRLIRSRDIVNDVGRDIDAPAEYQRADAAEVAVAAGKRLSEALRVMEEYAKTIDPSVAAAVEGIRYRGYELERRLHLIIDARRRFGRVRLYVIITESECAGAWYETAQAALRGGADCIQLREKALPDRVLWERATRLARLCRDHGALCMVNDRPDIAALSSADGVHLGQDDMPVAQARRIVGPDAIVGLSTHTIAQVHAASAAAPDYIAVGPMFATATKPQDVIAGPQTLAAAHQYTSLPLVAIGGIDADNVEQVASAAPCAICVCHAIVAHHDVENATTRLRNSIRRAAGEPAA